MCEKKRTAKDLAAVVNSAKKEIDSTKSVLEQKRVERIAEGILKLLQLQLQNNLFKIKYLLPVLAEIPIFLNLLNVYCKACNSTV